MKRQGTYYEAFGGRIRLTGWKATVAAIASVWAIGTLLIAGAVTL